MVNRRHISSVPRRLGDATGCSSITAFNWQEYMRNNNLEVAPYDAFFQETVNVGKNLFKADDLLLYKEKSKDDYVLVKVIEVRFVWMLVHIEGCARTDVRWVTFNDSNIKPITSVENSPDGTYRGATEPIQFLRYNWLRWIQKTLSKNEEKIADWKKFYPIDKRWRPRDWKIKVGQTCLAYDEQGFDGVLCPMTIEAINEDTNEVTLQYQGYTIRHQLKLDYLHTRVIFSYEMATHMGLHIGPPHRDESAPMVPFHYRLVLTPMREDEIHLSDSPPDNFVFQTGAITTRPRDPDHVANVTARELNMCVDRIPPHYITPPPVRPVVQPIVQPRLHHHAPDVPLIRAMRNRRRRSPHEDATDTSSEGETGPSGSASPLVASRSTRPDSLHQRESSLSGEETLRSDRDTGSSTPSSLQHTDSPASSNGAIDQSIPRIKDEFPRPALIVRPPDPRPGPIAKYNPKIHDAKYGKYFKAMGRPRIYSALLPWPDSFENKGGGRSRISSAASDGEYDPTADAIMVYPRSRTTNPNGALAETDEPSQRSEETTVDAESAFAHPSRPVGISVKDAYRRIISKTLEDICADKASQSEQSGANLNVIHRLMNTSKPTSEPTSPSKCTNLPGSSRSAYTAQRDRNLAAMEKASGLTDKVMDHLNNAKKDMEAAGYRPRTAPNQKRCPIKVWRPITSQFGTRKLTRTSSSVFGGMRKTPIVFRGMPKAKTISNTQIVANFLHANVAKKSTLGAPLVPQRVMPIKIEPAEVTEDSPGMVDDSLIRETEYRDHEATDEQNPTTDAAESPPNETAVKKCVVVRRQTTPVSAAKSAVQAASAMVKAVPPSAKPVAPSADSSSSAVPPTYAHKITIEPLKNPKEAPKQNTPIIEKPVEEIRRPTEQNKTGDTQKDQDTENTAQYHRGKNGRFAPIPATAQPKSNLDIILARLPSAPIPKATSNAKAAVQENVVKETSQEMERQMRLAAGPSSSRDPVISAQLERVSSSRSRKAVVQKDDVTVEAPHKKKRVEDRSSTGKESAGLQPKREGQTILQNTSVYPSMYEPTNIVIGLNNQESDDFVLNTRWKCRLGNHLDRQQVERTMQKQYKSDNWYTTVQEFFQDLVHCVHPRKLYSFLTVIGAVDPHERANRPAFLLNVYGPYGVVPKYVPIHGSILNSYLWLKYIFVQLNICPKFAWFAGSICDDCGIQYRRNPVKWQKMYKADYQILKEEVVPLPSPTEISGYYQTKPEGKDYAKIFLDHGISFPLLCNLTEEIVYQFFAGATKVDALNIMKVANELRKPFWDKLDGDKRKAKETGILYPALG